MLKLKNAGCKIVHRYTAHPTVSNGVWKNFSCRDSRWDCGRKSFSFTENQHLIPKQLQTYIPTSYFELPPFRFNKISISLTWYSKKSLVLNKIWYPYRFNVCENPKLYSNVTPFGKDIIWILRIFHLVLSWLVYRIWRCYFKNKIKKWTAPNTQNCKSKKLKPDS